MEFVELLSAGMEVGGGELILTAVGLPAAAVGVGIYRKARKAKKLKENLLG